MNPFEEILDEQEIREIEAAKKIVPIVLEAYQELVREQSQAVVLFHETYQELSSYPGLFGSKKDGLLGMLSCLLERSVNERDSHRAQAYGEAEVPTANPAFEISLEEALQRLAKSYPSALIDFQRHHRERGETPAKHLETLFVWYYVSKD